MFYANNINNLVRVWRQTTDCNVPLRAEWTPVLEKTERPGTAAGAQSDTLPSDLFLHERVW